MVVALRPWSCVRPTHLWVHALPLTYMRVGEQVYFVYEGVGVEVSGGMAGMWITQNDAAMLSDEDG